MLVEQWPPIGALDLLDHLGHPVRAEEGRALGALDLADLFGHVGALVEQREQLLIDAVDLHAQGGQRVGLDGLFGVAHARVFSKSRM